MTKNDIINEVVSSLVFSLNKDQLELVKSTFIVKMQGYEIHELCTLPSTEVRDVEEIESCRDNVQNDRERALLELMLSTGLRVGEIAKMRISDIDFDKRKIHIPEGKTDNAERDVFLTIKARNALQKYLGRRWHGFVFRPTRNILDDDVPMTTGSIEDISKRIGERANCHCNTTVHVYRKTFASMEYRRTKDVKYVSILLGHSSTAVTEKFYLVDDLKEIEYQALYAA